MTDPSRGATPADEPIREITFHQMRADEAIKDLVHEHIDKLAKLGPLDSCRVAIERPNRNESTGSGWRVRADVRTPGGHEWVVRREPSEGHAHERLDTVVRDVFHTAERRMRDETQKMRDARRQPRNDGPPLDALPPGDDDGIV